MELMLVDKYRPHSLSEIIGNEDAVSKVKQWAQKWAKGIRQSPIMLHGAPGCGKTSLAYALANDMGWERLETNASDVRNKGSLEAVLGKAVTESTLTGSLRLIVIDEVDGINGQKDRGAVPTIVSAIEKSGQPIILIANDARAQKLKAFRAVTDFIGMKRINPIDLSAHLKRITSEEGMKTTDKEIKEIVIRSGGDVRSAMIDLLSPVSHRDREIDLDDAISSVFKANDFGTARKSRWGVDVEPDMWLLWIEENIPRIYTKPEDIYRAFEALSRADIMAGRIHKQQHWGFMRYINDLSTSGIASAKSEKYSPPDNLRFPTYLDRMSKTVVGRAVMKNVCKKIGAVVHMSSHDVRRQLPIIAPFAVTDPSLFKLEDTELALLQRIALQGRP